MGRREKIVGMGIDDVGVGYEVWNNRNWVRWEAIDVHSSITFSNFHIPAITRRPVCGQNKKRGGWFSLLCSFKKNVWLGGRSDGEGGVKVVGED